MYLLKQTMSTLFRGISRILYSATKQQFTKFEALSAVQQQCNSARVSLKTTNFRGLHYKLPWMESSDTSHQIDVTNWEKEHLKLANDVITTVNNEIKSQQVGRLFAVVHLCGKQFKITENDLIVVQGYWPPNPGNQIKLEKVLLVGGVDFTLVGRPLLNRELVTVNATIIEKTLSHTKTRFRMKRRKQFKRINFYRIQYTTLRINDIEINGSVDQKEDVEGLDRIY